MPEGISKKIPLYIEVNSVLYKRCFRSRTEYMKFYRHQKKITVKPTDKSTTTTTENATL